MVLYLIKSVVQAVNPFCRKEDFLDDKVILMPEADLTYHTLLLNFGVGFAKMMSLGP